MNVAEDREGREQNRYRIGVDIGGTFTDTVVFDQVSGEIHLVKVPSVPSDPSTGFLNGFDRALAERAISIASVEFIGHSTTVATNTIIEEKGAEVGLIASEGFSDVLEIAYQTRPDLFNLMYDKPRPLVPRRRALGVPERIGPDGEVFVPLDEEAVAARARELRDAGARVIVIAFLHSYLHPANERRAGEIATNACPDIPVVLSSDVCPEFREYPRTSTAVVNAYLLPGVGQYVGRLERAIDQRGSPAGLHLMTSAGGVMTAAVAARHPVQLIESGPAATVIGAVFVAGTAGCRDTVVFDMGGTTAKVALVSDGTPRVSDQFEVGHMAVASDTAGRGRGYPVRTPTVEMVEVGAGGGSVGAIDPGGALTVGPESMGADPGPACYGNGGDRPTITDANLLLGRLNPEYFLGGERNLDVAAARNAIMEKVATPLGMTAEQAAEAIIEIGVARMAAALGMVSVRRGIDPRNYHLVACGGAGPLHAAAIAARAGMRHVLIPPAPGLTAALGLLATDLKHDLTRNLMRRSGELTGSSLGESFDVLQQQAFEMLREQKVDETDMHFVRQADMSYVGQSFQLRIPLPEGEITDATITELNRLFHRAHHDAYGFSSDEEQTLIVSLRLVATGTVTRPSLKQLADGGEDSSQARKGSRRVHFREAGGPIDCPLYERHLLLAGNVIEGPAIVEQMDTTTVLPPDSRTVVDTTGNLLVTL